MRGIYMNINDDNEALSKYKSRLKRKRLSMKFTQQELADLSGINIKSIASYEQSPEKINKASVETILKLCDCLGCEIDDIIDKESLHL